MKKDKVFNMASCMLSILDSLKLFDMNSLDISEETLSELMFRKMKGYNIDLNKELGFTHLEPVHKFKSINYSESVLEAINNDVWKNHNIGDEYTMDGKPDRWKIAYYPIFEDSKKGEKYAEPRALVEKPIANGIDLREVPLRYLTKI